MNSSSLNKLRRELDISRCDALLITKGVNRSYLSNFKGEGQLLITPTRQILFVDFRYREQAKRETRAWQICQRPSFQPLEDQLLHVVKKLKIKRLGFEELGLSFGFYRKLKRMFKTVKLVPTADIVERLRAIKSAEEISLLKKSAGLAVKSLAFAKKVIKPGRKEIEIARDIQYFMRKHGSEDCAFETIVASGRRSAMPHAYASAKTINNNETVLVDLGCRICGYNSDLTRTVFLGKIRGKIKQAYQLVIQAQQLVIKEVRPGVKLRYLDRVARQYIAKAGYRDCFGHALGHGIGKEVHEYPSIAPKAEGVLSAGMVFTVEPGIYIPGVGGVRVEDMVLVTNNGCEVLTRVKP